MSAAFLISIILVFKRYKAQCSLNVTSGQCNNAIANSLSPYCYIQTLDISSCVTDHQLKISEISIYYQYKITEQITLDFKMELFIPSSLNAFSATDPIENKITTAQTSTSLTKTWITSRKRVTFSNLNITLGCNPIFAMFVYPLNCNGGADPLCQWTSEFRELDLFLCMIGSKQETEETFLQYENTGNVPPDLTTIDIMSPANSHNNYRMEIEIVYTNTILCTPTETPTPAPTEPTKIPTETPTSAPTEPTKTPTETPTSEPTQTPTEIPTKTPTKMPTTTPTSNPSETPTLPFNEAEVISYYSTSLIFGPTSANENRSTEVDTIFTILLVIMSLAAVVSIVYVIRKHNLTKNKAKQTVMAVMGVSHDECKDNNDNVNDHGQDMERKTSATTDEQSEGIEKSLPDEGVQDTVYNPKLVRIGSAVVTNRDPPLTVGENMKKSEDDDSSSNDDLWGTVPQSDQTIRSTIDSTKYIQ